MIRNEIRKQLSKKGYTQKKIAEEANISEVTISKFLRNGCDVRLSTVEALADAFDCYIVLQPKGKAEQPEIPLNDDFGHILISAVRYAIGRATYMPGIVQNFIHPLLPYLSSKTLSVIERDIREAPSYGWEMDKPGWMKLLAAVQAEQIKRGSNK